METCLETFLGGMETRADSRSSTGTGSLETFLGGMETIVSLPSLGFVAPLETFLGGMETIRRGATTEGRSRP